MTAPTTDLPSARLKRQVTIKTRVTNGFRQRANQELAQEVQLVDNQLRQLESEYQYSLQQLEKLAQQGQNVKNQLDQLNMDAQNKRNQLTAIKLEVSKQLANLDKVEDGDLIVTGMLEGFVEVGLGDNIYDKIQAAEIILEEGVVKEIRG